MDIWDINLVLIHYDSDSNGIRTHNHLVRKRALNQLTKLYVRDMMITHSQIMTGLTIMKYLVKKIVMLFMILGASMLFPQLLLTVLFSNTAQKKFSIKDSFNKCDQIRSFRRIWSHLLKESLTKNDIFCAVKDDKSYFTTKYGFKRL